MTWIKHKYIALQLLVAAFIMGDHDEAEAQLNVLLGTE